MKTKDFNCVEMKRIGAEAVYEKIKNMSVKEQLDFWHKGSISLRQKKLKAQQINSAKK